MAALAPWSLCSGHTASTLTLYHILQQRLLGGHALFCLGQARSTSRQAHTDTAIVIVINLEKVRVMPGSAALYNPNYGLLLEWSFAGVNGLR